MCKKIGRPNELPTLTKVHDVPLHDTIRSCGALRLPCTSANRNDLELEPVLFFKPILSHLLCDIQSERSDHVNRPSPHSTTTEKTGYVYECTEKRPCCFATFCVSCSMELF